ncbi:sensor histidine kinase [Roseicella frigidaeris]|uniref:histidine kinase n=1 Tax=Roseicella frigidaeris TaxID=2230885 RepID=A0A327M867_9PROT|nr:sensor histidine kinase KdpD [Roseicella frigidaeris]RAI58667.1 sensor histidine kinase KdpD [Roseicella frigidaeris]
MEDPSRPAHRIPAPQDPPRRDPARPDPEALLALAAQEGRGRLKVFLGAAPGVGKTFEMLLQARRRQLGGADLVVGLVETHGRAETAAQLSGLELLPRLGSVYRGQSLAEFDLDAALARRPQILLLDELAHSNLPGSRHPKRWMDVEELRRAGIEVWTTMNVQHLESLSDAVARITGVRVAETVPDRVLAEADAVELIDIPPAELLERMRQGRIYPPEQARRALQGFFRAGNLAALRELALRRTAERVDAEISDYMRAKAIAGPWPAGERVLALLGGDAAGETVLRQARRIADALRAPLLALHVERPGGAAGDPAAALRLAEALGAAVETAVATDLPGAILAHARARNASHLVLGRGRPSPWRRLFRRSLAGALLRQATDFSLHLVPDPALPARPARARPALPGWLRWLAVPACTGLATAVGLATDGVVPEGALGMVYLAAIVAAAVAAGPAPAALAALLSFLCWNFLFLPPRYELAIASAQDVVGVVVFSLVAALLVGTTGGLGRSVRAARARLFSLRRLVEFSRRLGAPGTSGDLVLAIAEEAARITGQPACVLRPLPDAPAGTEPELVLRAAVPVEAEPEEAALAAARWAFAQARPAGRGTDTLPALAWQFRPMRTARGLVGLVGLRLREGAALDAERDRALDALLDQAAIAIERAELMEERARGAARAETEALRTALLTSLGHDLRTPLTAIRGAAETLRDSGARLPEATRADLLATVIEEAGRMGRFLSNILDMVRVEAGAITPRRERVDPAEALETAIARAEAGSGRRIGRDWPERLPHPLLDPALLDQVLANLLDNALKFSGPEGRVRAGARREGAELAIFVEDDGPGIPPADLPRIFDPFFRTGRTDRVAAGSGLGLAICRGLVGAMGGRIAAESPLREAPPGHGQGARMTLRFPA